MRLDHPEYLVLLALVGLGLVLVIRLFRLKEKAVRSAGTPSLMRALAQGASPALQRFKYTMVLAGFLFLVLALSGPQWGLRSDLISMAGRDLIVAVDISESMKAKDVEPDRLSRAKIEIGSLLNDLKGDRVGLLVFKGDALPVVPLTTDYDSMKEFLGSLDPDVIPQPGTNIGKAIEMSLRLLPREGPSGAVLLLTDGEDTYGGGQSAADSARAQGVKIFPVGIGSEKGEPIPVQSGGFKRDKSGKIVLSRLDSDLLERIAETTGGIFIRSLPGTIGVEKAYAEIRKMEKREWENRLLTRLQERYQYPLFMAYLLFFLEFLLSEARSMRPGPSRTRSLPEGGRSAPVRNAALAFGVLVFTAGSGPFERPNPGVEEGNRLMTAGKYQDALRKYEGEEKNLRDRAELSYNKGLARYSMKDFPNAKKEMSRSLRMPDRRAQQRALYNMGNADYRMENYSEAVEAFKEALLLDPGDTDAKINLELSAKKMKEKEQKKSGKESQEPPQPSKKEESQTPIPRHGSLSKEEALQILNSLMKHEVNLQPQKNMLQDRGVPLVDKDW